jgi:4-amino-4-deoxy-L-arabinose transferase-like glycosyltransferase
MIAAIPVLLSDADTSAAQSSRGGRAIGHDFLQANGQRSFFYFFLGRWACIPFSMLGAVACFAWARELYGNWSGLLAATLWCLCPNILAQGQLVAHDVPAAAFGLLATYCFWRWLNQPSWTRTVVAGAVLGLSLLTKMTALLYLGLWPGLWFVWLRNPANPRSAHSWGSGGLKLFVILVLAIDLLNLGYGFQESFASLSSYRFRSRSLAGIQETAGQVGLSRVPVPFPRAFMEGVDFQRSILEERLPFQFTYAMGQWSTRGWPLFYLYAFALKVCCFSHFAPGFSGMLGRRDGATSWSFCLPPRHS